MSRKRKQLQDGIKGPAQNDLDSAMYDGADLPDEFWSGLEEKSATNEPSTDAITISDDRRQMAYGRFQITPVGLQIPDDATLDEYTDMGRLLLRLHSTVQWALADWLIYGDNREWGQTYREIAEEYGYEIETLYTYTWVARNVHSSIRIEDLSFGHHRVVANLSPEEQRIWLQRALHGDGEKSWGIRRLTQEIRRSRIVAFMDEKQRELIDTEMRTKFIQIWRCVEQGVSIDVETINEVREWLNEVEKLYSFRSLS